MMDTMMKNILTRICAAAVILAVGCTKEEIKTFDDLNTGNAIFFYNPSYGFGNTYFGSRTSLQDSVETSFFLYPGQTEIEVLLYVSHTGFPEKDTHYKVAVVPEGTTATSADFSLPADPVFPAGERIAPLPVTLKLSDRVQHDTLRIELALVEGGDYTLGPLHQTHKIINFHNDVLKPSWWTGLAYVANGFGNFTKEKYLVVMQVTNNYPFSADTPTSVIREQALKVRAYLREQKLAGHPILEADGKEMVIPAGGN